MLLGNVKSVTLVEHVEDNLDLCKIKIEFDELYIFGRYTDVLDFVGKDVEYTVRKDIYKGEVLKLVANVYEKIVIQSVPMTREVVLIPPDRSERAIANFSIESLRYGDTTIEAIGLMSAWEHGSSAKAKWVDFTIVDKFSKAFSVRKFITLGEEKEFDVDEYMNAQLGRYIQFDLEYTKYGYQTRGIRPLNIDAVVPPEVAIAKTILARSIADDVGLAKFAQETQIIEKLEKKLFYEPGYLLVYIAAEMIVIDALCNISRSYDKALLKRVAIASRMYAISPVGATYSRPIANVIGTLRTCLAKDKGLMLILDVLAAKESPEKSMYIFINQFVTKVLNERRGLHNEEASTDASYNEFYDIFGSLLGERK
jgi:hypothetical protein